MIIDARPVVRLGLRRLLESSWELEELEHGGDATNLLTSVGGFEVAIVEMRPGDGNGAPSGTSTIGALLRAQPAIGIVGHGGRIERHAVREALHAGACGYVSKHSPPATMRAAVTAAAQAQPFLDPNADQGDVSGSVLTRRQQQILQLFADGLSTDQAARLLGLSAETIRTHAKATLPRLGAENRAHAIAIALRGSLID